MRKPEVRLPLIGLCCLLFFVETLPASSASAPSEANHHIASTTQSKPADDPLKGWSANPAETITVDTSMLYGGKASIRLQRGSKSASEFSAIIRRIPIEFAGSKIELRGNLRTKDVSGFAGLWLREDGVAGVLAFDNMRSRHLAGTTDWAEYSITLPLHSRANHLVFGVLLAGTGTAWTTAPQLFLDGKPISEAARIERKKTVLETDREFDDGSRIHIDKLSNVQLNNLVTLGEVWAFLKYFHPAITTGTRQWDFDLFRVLPRILDAATPEDANRILVDWIGSLGPVQSCVKCATEPATAVIQLPSSISWIRDEATLGASLSQALVHVFQNRKSGTQFYAGRAPEGNPDFDNEPVYGQVHFPDSGYQLLSAYRFWGIIQYWYPYRDLLADDWVSVLRKSITEITEASDGKSFDRAMLKLIAHVGDTHANLWSSLDARPPEGECSLPLAIRFVEGQPVVTEIASEDASKLNTRRGDVIKKMDGVPVPDLVTRWSPFYADSNDAARMRDIARSMTRGTCGDVGLDIDRDGSPMHLVAHRIPVRGNELQSLFSHDLPGSTFRLLSPDVAYLKLSSFNSADVDRYIQLAKNTKGLIIDLRNYPKDFAVYALGSHLVDHETPFARITELDLSNPGTFVWGETIKLEPSRPHYGGKIVILIDEVTQSQAEFTTMALRASPRATVIGSTTAGADGDISIIPLPGGRRAAISGIGIFYPDDRPTQRIGIVPDIVVRPTISGIRADRDEVLERALREVLGNAYSSGELRKLYH